jgi:hypothetical protein
LQPGQFGSDALACFTGKPRGLDVFTQFGSPVLAAVVANIFLGGAANERTSMGPSGNALSHKTCVEFSEIYICLIIRGPGRTSFGYFRSTGLRDSLPTAREKRSIPGCLPSSDIDGLAARSQRQRPLKKFSINL